MLYSCLILYCLVIVNIVSSLYCHCYLLHVSISDVVSAQVEAFRVRIFILPEHMYVLLFGTPCQRSHILCLPIGAFGLSMYFSLALIHDYLLPPLVNNTNLLI